MSPKHRWAANSSKRWKLLAANTFFALFALLTCFNQKAFSASTVYTNRFGFEFAAELLPGTNLSISFGPGGTVGNGYYTPPLVLSGIIFTGRYFTVDIKMQDTVFLRNYDSPIPLSIHFPTGAQAFGGYFSSDMARFTSSVPATVAIDSGEVFTFNAPTAAPSVNPAYFGFISATPFYDLDFDDGPVIPGYHEELIGQIYIVVNPPPSLSISRAATGDFDLEVNGTAGQTVVLLSSTNLVQWQPLTTNVLVSGRWAYRDTRTNQPGQNFYKLQLK